MSKMTYGRIAGIDKPVSRLVQGTTMVHDRQTEAEAFPVLDAAFAAGFTCFDTAHVYAGGGNERMVGRWIASRGIRDQVVILAKGAHHNADRNRVTPWDISSDIYDSLARFKADYLDLYVLHRDDPTFPVHLIVDVLNEHLRAGRIRAFGGSNWSHVRIQEANTYAKLSGQVPFAVSSPNFSLAEMHEEPWANCVSISGRKGEAGRRWYQESQFPVFCWSSLASGFWSGRWTREEYATAQLPAGDLVRKCYCREDNFQRLDRARQLAAQKGVSVPHLAIAWVCSQPLNLFPLMAPVNAAEIADNLAALQLKLTPQECAWLDLQADQPA
jgi:aryl-alcohol dehydrogenase-like predicted oxidoreductase